MKKQIMTSVRWISRQIDITQTQELRQNNLDTFRTIGHRNQVPSLCSVIRALITVKWSCYLRQSWRLFLRVITRASDEGSWRFHNHGESPRATFWLNALTSAITFIIRHLSKTGDIPRQVDMKLGCQLKGFKEQAVLLIMIVASVPQFHVYLLYLGAPI